MEHLNILATWTELEKVLLVLKEKTLEKLFKQSMACIEGGEKSQGYFF